MIYFCINNNYHLTFIRSFLKDLPKEEMSLIQIPYSLDIDDTDGFDKTYIYTYNSSVSFRRLFFRRKEIKRIVSHISDDLKIDYNDVLFINTEIDFINCLVINHFLQQGARIFLMEDGTATMTIYASNPFKRLFKEKIRAFFLNKLYGLKKISIENYNPQQLFQMADEIYSGLIVDFGKTIVRDLAIFNIKSVENITVEQNARGAIFLNSSYYFFYLSEEEYLSFLIEVLISISKNFTPFYFKFHPAESESFKIKFMDKWSGISELNNHIEVLKNDISAEKLVEIIKVKYSISFNSTGTLYHTKYGLEPIFLNHIMIPYVNPKTDFLNFEKFLDSIGCYYPLKLDEVTESFTAGILSDDIKRYSINEILKYK